MEELKLNNVRSSVYYCQNFITEEEENFILKKIYESPKPKWVQLSNRRLQNWGGLPHPKGMIAEEIPSWLQNPMSQIDYLGVFSDKKCNHVLVNEYLPGQGIMPHVDGPLFYPTITTISLESTTLLDFYSPLRNEDIADSDDKQSITSAADFESRFVGSILLEPRSLVVIQEEMYTKFLHGIKDILSDVIHDSVLNLDKTSHSIGEELGRKRRISLTIRHVPRVLKTKLWNFKSK